MTTDEEILQKWDAIITARKGSASETAIRLWRMAEVQMKELCLKANRANIEACDIAYDALEKRCKVEVAEARASANVFTDETVEKVAKFRFDGEMEYLTPHSNISISQLAREWEDKKKSPFGIKYPLERARSLFQSCGFKSEEEVRTRLTKERNAAISELGGIENSDKKIIASWLESEEAARLICLGVRVPYKPRLIKRLGEIAARLRKGVE